MVVEIGTLSKGWWMGGRCLPLPPFNGGLEMKLSLDLFLVGESLFYA